MVLFSAPNPRMQRWPSQNTDEIAQMLSGPSSFSEVMSTTGVPKYKIAGEMVECVMVKPRIEGNERIDGENEWALCKWLMDDW